MTRPLPTRTPHALSLGGVTLVASVALASALAWGCGPKPTSATPTEPTAATTDPATPSAAPTPETPATEAATAEPAAPAPDKAAMEALVAKRCVGCHKIDKVNEKKADAAGWEAIVADMEKRGLKIGADERKQIIEYLASR